jgi:hypothetical protein
VSLADDVTARLDVLDRQDRRDVGCACLTLLILPPSLLVATIYAIVWIWRHA